MTTTTLTARINVTLGRGQNNREHYRVRAIRVLAEREATTHALAAGDWRGECVSLRRLEIGARVTLVRPYSVTPLDSDNLSASFKAVRDAIAAFLGVDDASARLHWIYQQQPAVVLGTSRKPGKTRASPDRDTRPMVRIEVMPVEDIDPQQQRIAQLERLLREAHEYLADSLDPAQYALAAHIRAAVTDTNDHQEQ